MNNTGCLLHRRFPKRFPFRRSWFFSSSVRAPDNFHGDESVSPSRFIRGRDERSCTAEDPVWSIKFSDIYLCYICYNNVWLHCIDISLLFILCEFSADEVLNYIVGSYVAVYLCKFCESQRNHVKQKHKRILYMCIYIKPANKSLKLAVPDGE